MIPDAKQKPSSTIRMPRRTKKVAGSWMTPISSCLSSSCIIGQPGPHPEPPPALPTTSVNPYLPPPTTGGMLSAISCLIGQPGPHPQPPPALPTTSVNPYLPSPTYQLTTGGMSPVNIPSAVPSSPPPQAPNMPPHLSPHPSPNNNTGQPTTGGVLDPLSQAILFVNTNPYIIGCFMLALNLGGRFLSLELTKKQEEFLAAPWLRPALFFTVVFIATRNLAAAFWVTLLFFAIIWVVANENSPYCLIPSWCGHDIQKEKKIYEENVKKFMSLNKANEPPKVVPPPAMPKE